MKLKKLAMSSLRDATRSLLLRRSMTSCANAALIITFGVACKSLLDKTSTGKQVQVKPVAEVAIYEKNNGKQPVQAELLAKIAAGYAKLGQQDKASKLLTPAIQTAKINKSIQIKSDLLEELGIIYVEMGQYDKALQVAKSLQVYESLYKDIELKHITTRLAQAGQYEKALQVAKLVSINGMSSSEEDSITSQSTVMSEIALKYAQTGQKAQAEQILVQALQKAKTSDLMAEIALKYAQFGQKAKALQVLAQASQNAEYPDNIAKVAVKYAQVGQKDKAEQLLTQAIQKIRKPKDGVTFSQDYFLTEIAVSYAKVGQFNQAIEIAKTIYYPGSEVYKDKGAHITPDGLINGGTSLDVFLEIAKRCAVAGRYEQALQVSQEIKWTNSKSEALGVLALQYAKKSQYEQAFKVLKELDKPYVKVYKSKAWADLAVDYGAKRQYEQAFKVLKENVESDSNKALALTKIAAQATQVEPSTKAEQVFSQALEVAKTIKSRDDKVRVITAIAIEYPQLKQKDKSEQLLAQALQIAENIHQ